MFYRPVHALRKDIIQMLCYRASALAKQFGDQLLCEPNGFILDSDFNAVFTGLRGKY
jgi:hypothetical protein